MRRTPIPAISPAYCDAERVLPFGADVVVDVSEFEPPLRAFLSERKIKNFGVRFILLGRNYFAMNGGAGMAQW